MPATIAKLAALYNLQPHLLDYVNQTPITISITKTTNPIIIIETGSEVVLSPSCPVSLKGLRILVGLFALVQTLVLGMLIVSLASPD